MSQKYGRIYEGVLYGVNDICQKIAQDFLGPSPEFGTLLVTLNWSPPDHNLRVKF